MTEVALVEPRESELILWAHEAEAAHRIASSLVKTSFVPTSMRDKPAEATAAILAGKELGLQPMASLRSINIIQGTPALTAVAMRGLVQSHGHRITLKKQTPTEAVVEGCRHGEDDVQTSRWTIDRAQRLGLITKDNWRKQPEAMLVARATSECCRLTAADVLLGMPYSSEELADESGGDAPKRRMRRQPVDDGDPVPELETPADDAAHPVAPADVADPAADDLLIDAVSA